VLLHIVQHVFLYVVILHLLFGLKEPSLNTDAFTLHGTVSGLDVSCKD
jgi:hypothetical protein